MSKSALLKKSARDKVANPTTKGLTKIQKDLYGVSSLSFIKRKKIENVDKKFMQLKSELSSLFFNPSINPDEKVTKNIKESNRTAENNKSKKRKVCSTSSSEQKARKFSDWLSDTVDKMDFKSTKTKPRRELDCNGLLSSITKPHFTSEYNMTLLPDHEVERLLYKSFQLKNLGIYALSSSDDSEEEEQKSSKVKKQKKQKCKRRSTKSSETFSSGFPRRNFKRKRALFDSDVEIINIETDLSRNELNEIHQGDLDAERFDRNKSIFIESTSECSDLETIEDTQSNTVNMEKKNDSAEVHTVELDFSTNAQEQSTNKSSNPDTKRIWECPICFEPSQGQSIVATMCGHIFCKACLEAHESAQGKFCPTCRLDLSNKPPITLFNL